MIPPILTENTLLSSHFREENLLRLAPSKSRQRIVFNRKYAGAPGRERPSLSKVVRKNEQRKLDARSAR